MTEQLTEQQKPDRPEPQCCKILLTTFGSPYSRLVNAGTGCDSLTRRASRNFFRERPPERAEVKRPKACPYRRSDQTYWARVRYVDESGKTREESARAESLSDAIAKSNELVRKHEKDNVAPPSPITFNNFAASFIPHIEGLKSYRSALGFLNTLRGYFGNKQLKSITYKDIQGYIKKRRGSISARTGKRLKTASINREVALLSRMFKEAIEQRLVNKNPFKEGEPLIKPEAETRRTRTLSTDEEERLLAACTGRRAHIRPVILAALDTGATKSQILRTTWGDTHIGLREIRIRSPNSGLLRKARIKGPLADALAHLQEKLLDEYSKNPSLYRGKDAPLFSDWIADMRIFRDFKSAFRSACRAAKIKDLRFHDLRRTYLARRQAKVDDLAARLKRDD